MNKINLFLSLLLVAAFNLNTTAQNSGDNDATFNPTDAGFGLGDGTDGGDVTTTAVQSDGKIIIGGYFSSFTGTSRNKIARLNADGTLDTSFNPGTGADANVNTIAIQPDGKIIIGGDFNSYNGTNRSKIARLNTDGTLDMSFNPGTGANIYVQSIAIQSDGQLIIGGKFTTYNGTNINRIARLNTNGTLDTSFNVGTGADNTVNTISIQTDGKIIIGGGFYTYNGTSRNRIARLNTDGTLDISFNIGSGATNGVMTVAIQTDGKIIIGGFFTSYNGVSRNKIARLNNDGTLDTSFNPGSGADNYLETSAIQSDGKIIIGGWFTTYNGTSSSKIARLNTDGTLDTSFNLGTGANYAVYAIAIQPDGKIIFGGDFIFYNGTSRNHIARLNTDGTLDAFFNAGSGVGVGTLENSAIQPDGKIIIVGTFLSYNEVSRNHIARLNTDGTTDTSFNPGIGVGADYFISIYTTAIQPDGKIIIGGSFTTYNGMSRKRIARLNADGTLDTSFNVGSGADNTVKTIAIQPDGKIIIGGDFTSYNGTSRNKIVRLNTNGTLDTSFNIGSGANNTIISVTIQPDGKIIIGGDFTTCNGVSRNRIARLNSDGTLDTFFNIGTGANNTVHTTTIQPDGKIIIGGNFTTYNGTSRNRIVRLNTDGTLDTSFNIGSGANNIVSTTTFQPNGKIIIGGLFTVYNGASRNYVARLNTNGTLDISFNVGTGANNTVHTTAIQPDGKIIIGGRFTAYKGTGRNRIARIFNCTGFGTDVQVACDSLVWINGNTYTTSTNTPFFTIVGGSFTGCDSVVTLNLTINANSSTDVVTACDSMTWIDGNTYYTSTNTPTFTLINVAGCDSLVTLNLTINNPTTGSDVISGCDSITWIDGNTYTLSTNTPTFTIVGGSVTGCDSIVTLNLTINNSTIGADVITACNSITWIDGNTYTNSTNTPTFTLTNVVGCDSIVTLNLTINATSSIDSIVACNSITWIDGNTYTTSTNTPTFILTNSVGCDSIVTLNLTINATSSIDTIDACDSITWIDGNTYTTSTNTPTFILTNSLGCDSVITLYLTINSNSSTDVVTACDSFTWIDGNTYTSSTNIPTFTLTNATSCDSVVTLNLTISNLSASYTSIDNGNGNYNFTNTSSGNINQTHWAFGDGTTSTVANPNHTFSANGTYVVVLTLNDSTSSSCMDYYLDTLVVTGVVVPLQCVAGFVMYPDTAINNVIVVNSSTGTNLTYLWILGDGDTTYVQFPTHTYATSGPYYLCLTIDDGAGCVDMYCDSIGENGVVFNKQTGFTINVIAPPLATQVNEQAAITSGVDIFPNPTTAEFIIELASFSPKTQLSIVSVEGKTVYTNNNINTNKIVINAADWSKGIYMVKITDKQSSQVVKLIKQ